MQTANELSQSQKVSDKGTSLPTVIHYVRNSNNANQFCASHLHTPSWSVKTKLDISMSRLFNDSWKTLSLYSSKALAGNSVSLLTTIEALENWATFFICRVKDACARQFRRTGGSSFTNGFTVITNTRSTRSSDGLFWETLSRNVCSILKLALTWVNIESESSLGLNDSCQMDKILLVRPLSFLFLH